MNIKAVPTLACSFCGKSAREIFKLIAGPTSFICDECVGLCADIIADERAHQRITKDKKLLMSAEDAERLQWMRTWTCAKPPIPSEKGDDHG